MIYQSIKLNIYFSYLKIRNKEKMNISQGSMEMVPWNSTRMSNEGSMRLNSVERRVRKQQKYKKYAHDFIDYSSQNQVTRRSSVGKPQTAPSKDTRQRVSEQLKKVGAITREDLLTEDIGQNAGSFQYYSHFRPSIGGKNQLLFLQPHIKKHIQTHRSNKPDIKKIKNELYRSVTNNEVQPVAPVIIKTSTQRQKLIIKKNKRIVMTTTTNSFVKGQIEYLTDYDNTQHEVKQSCQKKQKRIGRRMTIGLLRQKLKNKSKDTKYLKKMEFIKSGRGIPITTLQ